MIRVTCCIIVLLLAIVYALPQEASPTPDRLRTPLVGPGVGASTDDARARFRAAGEAVQSASDFRYDAVYKGIGSMSTRSPYVSGSVSLSRLASDNPINAKMAVKGTYFAAGAGDESNFHTTFDGHTIRRVRFKEKTVITRSLDTGNPTERSLGFVTSFFGGGAYQLLMLELISNEAFARHSTAPVVEYEGRSVLNGTLCHVLYVEFDRDPRGRIPRERWYLGVADDLPRGVEQISEDNDGRYGAFTITLSNLRRAKALAAREFLAGVPRGFTVKPAVDQPKPPLLEVGEIAPDWQLSDPAGNPHKLSDYRGKLVVLDFWATWCGPCVRAMPELQILHDRYKDLDVKVIGINVWEESNAPEFAKKNGFTYDLLLKGESAANAFRVSTLPTLYVIGRDGKVLRRLTGLDETLPSFIAAELSRSPERD